MSEHDTAARDLAARQAEGLRAVARLIEQNPELAEHMQFALAPNFNAFVAHTDENPRARLQHFRRAALAEGADVSVDNGIDFCTVAATFGAVTLHLLARAEHMAGQDPRPAAAYRPLADIDPASEEC
ncbi:hypothetical protein ACFXPA_44130 [Amycolatopsis sp. NPDC059090]|uniref:hypothetical protein n=1 Tax=unclassified Amycolatopsis TaxID=2618356 RepID=UPI00366CFCA3